MIKEFAQYFLDQATPKIIEVDDFSYSTKQLHRMSEPTPIPIKITTLQGVVDYLKNDIDDIVHNTNDIFIHVISETKVEVCSTLQYDSSRHTFLTAEAKTPRLIFGQYMDAESFNVFLQSCFLDFGSRADILKIIGNIQEENVKSTSDNGISQSVVAKIGIVTVGLVEVPNPVLLTPFRTFIEVEQPESKYILRVKEGPSCGLFEADGGEWRIAAMKRIFAYLQEQLPDIKILS
jgi:hypothetical protein